MRIPLCKPHITEDDIKMVEDVLVSGWLAHGPKSEEFEKEFADYIRVKRAVSVNSCASALFLALKAMKITGEVILPSFTFVASANAIVAAGAKPIFVDVCYDTCNIDPEEIRKKITKDTEAIMPVHFAGQSCKMDEIMEIAEKHCLKVIEDSAETLGGEYKGKKAGSFGIGCFSFYPTKNITTGEGGMITTDNEDLADNIATLKAHGISSTTYEREKKEKPWLRAATIPGYNFRLCDILAALGLAQLRRVDEMNNMRRKHAVYLNKNLNSDKIDKPVESKESRHVYQMYTIKLKDTDRTRFIAKLREKGIGASVHFDPPVHLHPCYKTNQKLEVTEKLSKSIVTLPMFPQLKREELDYMITAIWEALK